MKIKLDKQWSGRITGAYDEDKGMFEYALLLQFTKYWFLNPKEWEIIPYKGSNITQLAPRK